MAEIIVACDPGASGAFAVFIDGELIDVEDMPFLTIQVGKTKRKRVDLDGTWQLLKGYQRLHVLTGDKIKFVIEEVGPMPKDGPTQAFNFGAAATIPAVCAAALGWPRSYIRPADWKRKLKLRKEKDEARLRAKQLFPSHAAEFGRVKDDGRAEAALIGYWALHHADA